MLSQPTGPTLLGFDVILIGTILIGVAAAILSEEERRRSTGRADTPR